MAILLKIKKVSLYNGVLLLNKMLDNRLRQLWITAGTNILDIKRIV